MVLGLDLLIRSQLGKRYTLNMDQSFSLQLTFSQFLFLKPAECLANEEERINCDAHYRLTQYQPDQMILTLNLRVSKFKDFEQFKEVRVSV